MKVTALVFISVCINFSASIIMNFAAKHPTFSISLIFIGIALALNLIRFVYWGSIIKKYDLSHAYPITALFFPLIYFYSLYYEKEEFSFIKLLSVGIIILGVILLQKERRNPLDLLYFCIFSLVEYIFGASFI